MPSSEPTLKDVAREAGVSSMTVSRVLNETGSVSEKTRERVKVIARQLGYTINPVASSLARRRNRGATTTAPPVSVAEPAPVVTKIGCVIGGKTRPSFLEAGKAPAAEESLSIEIWEGIQKKGQALGYEVIPFWHQDPAYQRRGGLGEVLAKQGVTACVCFGFAPKEAFHLEQTNVECFWATRPPIGVRGSFCDVDRFIAISLTVKELAASLYRRPALIFNDDTHPEAQTLLEAAFSGAVRSGLPQSAEVPTSCVEDSLEEEATSVSVRFWIKRNRPDAILTTGRVMVDYLTDRLAELGYKHIPVIDLELDERSLREHPAPETLIGAVHSGARLGSAAVEMLHSRIADPGRDRNDPPIVVTVASRWHGALRG